MKIEMFQKTCLIVFYLTSLNGAFARFVQLRAVFSTALILIKYHDWASKTCVYNDQLRLDSRTNHIGK